MTKPTGVLLNDDEIVVDRRIMDNDEERVRAVMSGGTSYIRTIAGKEGGWQNSHFHKHTAEFFVVVTRWMVLVDRAEPLPALRVYRPGETVTSKPGVEHNVYLPAHAVIDTLKYQVTKLRDGDKESDWYRADEAFDRWTKSLTEGAIAKHAGVMFETLCA